MENEIEFEDPGEFVAREHPTDAELKRRFGAKIIDSVISDNRFKKIEDRWFLAEQNPTLEEFVATFYPTDEMIARVFGRAKGIKGFAYKLGNRWYPTDIAVKMMKTELSSPARMNAMIKAYGEGIVKFLFDNGFVFGNGMVSAKKPEMDKKLAVRSPFFRLIPLGGGSNIGNSCLYVRVGEHYVILDAGSQEMGGFAVRPAFGALNDLPPVEAIFISHAHADHIGALEELAQITDAPIYMTEGTYEIYRIEYEKINGEFPDWLNDRIHTVKGGNIGDLQFEFTNAGHIDGSAMIYLASKGDSVLYTGDFNLEYTEFQKPAKPVSMPVGTLITEATYGNAPTRKERNERVEELVSTVAKYISEGKFVFLPVFAKGRFEEVVSIIDRAIENGRFSADAVGLGMGTDMAKAVGRTFKHVKLVNSDDMREIKMERGDLVQSIKADMDKPHIVIASSGFMDNGISQQLVSEALNRESVVVIKTGYADKNSMAGSLTKKGDKIELTSGEYLEIKCDVENVSLSAHASREDIIEFILEQKPHDIIFVHRESGLKELKQELESQVDAFYATPSNLCLTYTYGHYTERAWKNDEMGNTKLYACECGATFSTWEGAIAHARAENHRIIDKTSIFTFIIGDRAKLPAKYRPRIREVTRMGDELRVRADFTDDEAAEIAKSIGAEYRGKQLLYNNASTRLSAFISDATRKVSDFIGHELITPRTVKRDLPFGYSGFYSPDTDTIAIPINMFSSDEDALLVITHETAHYAQHYFNPKAFRDDSEETKEFIEGFAQFVTEKVFGSLKRFMVLYHELGVPEYYMNGRRKFLDIERVYGTDYAIRLALSGSVALFQNVWAGAYATLNQRYEKEAEEAPEKLDGLLKGIFRKSLADPERIKAYVLKRYKKYVLDWTDDEDVAGAVAQALADYYDRKVRISPGAAVLVTKKYGKTLYDDIMNAVRESG